LKNLYIPGLGIATEGLGFHIVPPHILLTLRKSPSGFAGHGAGLAGNTTVGIENKGKLPAGVSLLIGIIGFSPQVPIINFWQCPSSFLVSHIHTGMVLWSYRCDYRFLLGSPIKIVYYLPYLLCGEVACVHCLLAATSSYPPGSIGGHRRIIQVLHSTLVYPPEYMLDGMML
jgi:hypothetical protein